MPHLDSHIVAQVRPLAIPEPLLVELGMRVGLTRAADRLLLGHVSIQTTERYLGCKQKLRHAVNDRLGIEPDAA